MTQPAAPLTYRDAGVDIDAGDRLVENIKPFARKTLRKGVLAGAAAPPAQLTLREDLATRLAWGLVFQVHALTDESKAQALAEHAASRGFRLAPEVSDFLLTRARRDLPTLLATLDALDRYSLETRRPVTVPLVRELLLAAENRGSRLAARDSGGPG